MTLSGANSISAISAKFALRDPLVRAAEVLANVSAKVIQAACQQLLGDARRIIGFTGEQADRLGGANAVQHAFQGMRGQVGKVRLFPTFLDAGKGELHAADVWQHFEAILAQAVAQVAGDAVKQRIAAGDHHHALFAQVVFQNLHDFLEIGTDRRLLGLELAQRGAVSIRSRARVVPAAIIRAARPVSPPCRRCRRRSRIFLLPLPRIIPPRMVMPRPLPNSEALVRIRLLSILSRKQPESLSRKRQTRNYHELSLPS